MKKIKFVLQYVMLLTVMLTLVTTKLEAKDSLRTRVLGLDGTWECALGTGAEQAWTSQGQAGLIWNTTTVPGNNLDPTGANVNNIQFAWARRDFTLTAQQAQSLAILNWIHVTLGAKVYINGLFVGYNEPIGPYKVMIPSGILQAGTNQIVMKFAGWVYGTLMNI